MNDQQIEQEINAKGLTAPDNGTSPMQGIETQETADNLPQGVEQ